MIRKDIYDAMINKMYADKSKRVSSKISDLLNTEWSEEIYFEIGADKLGSKTLEFFNSDDYLTNKILYIVRLIIKAGASSMVNTNDISNAMLTWSLICGVYRDLGKSFYPNVRKHRDMKPIYTLNSIVNDHIDTRRKANIEYWSEENGYSADEAGRSEWDDRSKLD